MKESKRILVTGGLGFIGSHLCLRLLGDGHRVLCLDDLSTGRLENLRDLESFPGFEYRNWDIIRPVFPDGPIDEIYNLACPASPAHYQKDPVKTLLTSVAGMRNMLELARTHRCRILQASTSEVYGDPLEHPQRESYHGNVSPTGPRACYDEGKRCAETLCMDYHRMYGVPVKIIRIFNTYGPRMAPDDGRVISNFIVQALRGAPLTVYGTGGQTRSCQYVDDLIEGMLCMMASDEAFVGPVNLGNPEECTVKELAMRILRLARSDSRMVFLDLPVDDPKRRRADISLARHALGWSPRVCLDEGLVRTIQYYRQFLTDTERREACRSGRETVLHYS